MLQALQAAGLTLKPLKLQFGPRSEYSEGIRIGNDRIKAIVRLPAPKTVQELRLVLGMVNFVRKFFPDLSTILAPLVALTKNR